MPDLRRPDRLDRTRSRVHAGCVVCSPDHAHGLHLTFERRAEGGVRATFPCGQEYEGYPGYVHGGIVSSLLDGAMTNALFADGYVALTAELTVRFLEPVLLGEPSTVTARIEQVHPRLLLTSAEVTQGARTKAVARGKFIRHPDLPGEGDGT